MGCLLAAPESAKAGLGQKGSELQQAAEVDVDFHASFELLVDTKLL